MSRPEPQSRKVREEMLVPGRGPWVGAEGSDLPRRHGGASPGCQGKG